MYKQEYVEKETLNYFNGDRLATQVWMTKYALKDRDGNFLELTPEDMHDRLAGEFARIERKTPKAQKEIKDHLKRLDDLQASAKVKEYLDKFLYVVPQGSPMMGIGNNHANVSLSNCVVVPGPKDNMSSIVDTAKHLANLFKRRCGVGTDLSDLRPENAPVKNGAKTSTGAWSFADLYSFVCRQVAQNGRRGALMLTMHVKHPDIYKFVKMKEDLSRVTGANISVKITDEFMEAVKKDKEFTLQFPIDSPKPSYTKTIKAKDLWMEIVGSATKSAEPGLLMWDNIIKNLPAECYAEFGFATVCVNPCAEIALSAFDSCRLISLNLKHLVVNPFTPQAYFDYEKWREVVRVGMRLSDDLVDLEIEKLENIINICDEKSEKELWIKLLEAARKGRRTGLGTHGLADALARLCIKYDSEEALVEIDKIYSTLKNEAYRESALLAAERGPFEIYNSELEVGHPFIESLDEDVKELMRKYGRRNISILTNAPTGSVSIESQTSSGVEPVFKNFYIRRRKLDGSSNERVDFVDELGDKWQNFEVFHKNIQEYIDLTGNKNLPDYFVEAESIDWEMRLKVQATMQKHIDHAISSTINLPKGTSPELVSKLYMKGWELGLKGITIYVDGCRSGVLVSKEDEKKEEFVEHSAPKRGKILDCNIHRTRIKGEPWLIFVGLKEGKPYEIFGGKQSEVDVPTKLSKCQLLRDKKKSGSKYHLIDDGEYIVEDITESFDNPDNSAFTRIISLSLRHGANVKYLVEQIQKDKNSSMFSFAKGISRILKKYIPDGTPASDKICLDCGAAAVVFEEGCMICKNCGSSKCG